MHLPYTDNYTQNFSGKFVTGYLAKILRVYYFLFTAIKAMYKKTQPKQPNSKAYQNINNCKIISASEEIH